MSELLPDSNTVSVQDVGYHRGLLQRSEVMPAREYPEDCLSLADSMLGIAAIGCCFALLREWVVLGIVALGVVVPALLRTHVILNRRKSEEKPAHVVTGILAFVLSIFEIGLVLGIITLGIVFCVVVGGIVGHYIGFYMGYPRSFSNKYTEVGRVIGACLLTIPGSVFALGFLAPRLLLIRDRMTSTI